ncbi:zinc ribbon domain-containing protein [Methanobrevibacter sp.]|uniref:zinc ribbon domain-containing protein n=1 Tax=Methanobrevibacter sp. TaxID=66852 RepID=UPI00388EBE02
MKQCDVCGTFNSNENNYCTNCGCYIVEENICPFCGHKNPDSNNYCDICGKQISSLSIEGLDVLFSEYNLSLIQNANISDYEYHNILDSIFKRLDYATISGKTPKDRIFKIAEMFRPVIPKSSGSDHGNFKNTKIFYDDRLDDSLQIGVVIHELAHYLLFELSLNLLCKILNVNKSVDLKVFIDFFLSSPTLVGVNEFFAHTVENRYIPHAYRNFSSFNNLVEYHGYDIDLNMEFILIGISFAKDIIACLDNYIDERLRELIKLQFKEDNPNVFRKICYEIEEIEMDDVEVPDSVKISILILLMARCFEYFYNNEEARKELEDTKFKFED